MRTWQIFLLYKIMTIVTKGIGRVPGVSGFWPVMPTTSLTDECAMKFMSARTASRLYTSRLWLANCHVS